MLGLSSSLSPFGQCHMLSGGLLCLEKYSYPQRTKQSQLDTCRLALCTLTQSSLPGSMLRRATGPVGSYTTTMAGDRGREDFFQEFWVTVTKSVLWLWKKDWFCGSNLNLVLMGMERNQTGKERLWFLVKNLEIREATVHGNAFSDLQNSLTIYWMR